MRQECWDQGLLLDTQKKTTAALNEYKQREWTVEELIRAGAWGLDLLVVALPEVFCWKRIKRELFIDVHPDTQTGLDALIVEVTSRRPPPITQPQDWVDVNKGGPTEKRLHASLIRDRYKENKEVAEKSIKKGTMQPVLAAVNKLQSVPLMINQRVLDVLEQCYDKDMTVLHWEKSAHRDWVDIEDEEEDDLLDVFLSPDRAAEYRAAVGEERDSNTLEALWRSWDVERKQKARRIEVDRDIAAARQIANHRFWAPMNLDFRSRVYSLPTFNYQGDDHVRALFLFAEGEAIGKDGLKWLKVHLANCGDFELKLSKRPFSEREAWVDGNIERIKRIVSNPMGDLRWTEASKPFQFLAACYELTDAMKADDLSFETHLPVNFDGSCSGIQHLCAMTRDLQGGSLVNLTPSCKPQDIYQTVAEKVNEKLQAIVADHGASPEDVGLARLFLAQQIDRGVVKRNVMTYSYGSTLDGMKTQLMEKFPIGEKQALFLARQVRKTIEDNVDLPAKAMGFLQKLMRIVAQQQRPLYWTTPIGFPLINRYHKKEEYQRPRIYLHEHGRRE